MRGHCKRSVKSGGARHMFMTPLHRAGKQALLVRNLPSDQVRSRTSSVCTCWWHLPIPVVTGSNQFGWGTGSHGGRKNQDALGNNTHLPEVFSSEPSHCDNSQGWQDSDTPSSGHREAASGGNKLRALGASRGHQACCPSTHYQTSQSTPGGLHVQM